MPNRLNPLRHNQLVEVARLYYLRNLTHQQIAEKLGLSRVKVTRMLQEAREAGIVEFRIADPIAATADLQSRLEELFGLKQAVVVPSGDTARQTMDTLGRTAAQWLAERVREGCIVGVGWGRTLNALVPYLKPGPSEVTVVSLTGGLKANSTQPNPYDTATAIASALRAEARYLLLPAVADSVATRELLLALPSTRAITDLWERVDIALMSIGLLAPDTGVFPSLADPESGVAATVRSGGVGDLLARPFNRDGHFLDTDLARRTIAIDPERLKRVPLVAGIAAGEEKTNAIAGALRTGVLNVLITDEAAARGVLREYSNDGVLTRKGSVGAGRGDAATHQYH